MVTIEFSTMTIAQQIFLIVFVFLLIILGLASVLSKTDLPNRREISKYDTNTKSTGNHCHNPCNFYPDHDRKQYHQQLRGIDDQPDVRAAGS
jgi:hypothetical protein